MKLGRAKVDSASVVSVVAGIVDEDKRAARRAAGLAIFGEALYDWKACISDALLADEQHPACLNHHFHLSKLGRKSMHTMHTMHMLTF